jgi:geranyl-CoA carboxylase alpha subunit
LVTDVDLVAWQLTIAAGGLLPKTQEEVTITGHAMEVRLYAEDPALGFMPQTGKVLRWNYSEGIGMRMDAGIQQGQTITPFYDPMLAKVIAYGENRDVARRRLMASLKKLNLLGVRSNRGFLYNILNNDVFANGGATTGFIEKDFNEDETLVPHSLSEKQQALAAWLFYLKGAAKYTNDNERSFWRNSNPAPTWLDLRCLDAAHSVGVNVINAQDKQFNVVVGEQVFNFSLLEMNEQELIYIDTGIKTTFNFSFDGDDTLFLESHEGCVQVDNKTHAPAVSAESSGNGQIKASMDGGIIDVLVEVGAQVNKGDTLVILEAMKMEHAMKADTSGVIKAVQVTKGDQVKGRQLLVEIEVEETEKESV